MPKKQRKNEKWSRKFDPTHAFAWECLYRINRSKNAIALIQSYARKIKSLKNLKGSAENSHLKNEYGHTTRILADFIVLNTCTLFDGDGTFSLKLNKNKMGKYISVQHDRFNKIIKVPESIYIEQALNEIIRENSTLITRLFSARNQALAHANIFFEDQFKGRTALYRNFPCGRLWDFFENLEIILAKGILSSKKYEHYKKTHEFIFLLGRSS